MSSVTEKLLLLSLIIVSVSDTMRGKELDRRGGGGFLGSGGGLEGVCSNGGGREVV